MVAKRCVYRDCESDSRYWDRFFMKGVCFIRFPNPVTHRERSLKWVKACDRKDLTIDCVDDKTYICSKHFLGGNGPTRESFDPLSPQQLLEANQMTIDSNISNTIDISSETQTNSYFNSFNNNLNLNFSQTNESNLITNIFNKNQTFDTNCLQFNPTKVLNNFSTNHNLITSSISNEPNVVDIESSDNSIEFNNEIINDSLLLPSIPSLSPQNTTKIVRNEVQKSDSKKSYTEVANSCLPLFMIPSTNQSTSSSFSVSMMSSNEEKNWFKNITENDFSLKLNHLKLSYGRSDKRVTFSSIEGSVVSKQLIVDISGHFDVKVFGLSISAKNSFYRLVPNIIQNELEFNSILNLFSKWKVCVANESTERVLEDKIIAIRAFVCNITNTIRSRNCELFLPEIGSIRCKYCRTLLNRIRKLKTIKTSVIND